MTSKKQTLVTLDMEGVLTPEAWIAVAEATGIEALRRTTRDEPDYDVLMRYRLDLLKENGVTLSKMQEVVGALGVKDGALEFLDELRELTQVAILSDTFEQFAAPFMRQLKYPMLLCHRFAVEDDMVVDYEIRVPDPKRKAVAAFRSLNYQVIAAGDSYNDTSMLIEADDGFLIHAPDKVKADFPQFEAAESLEELLGLIKGVL
ncbi:MAG: bifunctional phosphoserine phosphatase/homoserine phosphotransferase ThrH [Verrucomicrobiales bacterium]|nr:bifunctional phosphoserine phosphatase/homoserine phosphotransferase ThrH [Verrucomicrobiota bacterium JB025]